MTAKSPQAKVADGSKAVESSTPGIEVRRSTLPRQKDIWGHTKAQGPWIATFCVVFSFCTERTSIRPQEPQRAELKAAVGNSRTLISLVDPDGTPNQFIDSTISTQGTTHGMMRNRSVLGQVHCGGGVKSHGEMLDA